MSSKPWAIRDSVPGDHNFISATFLRGLYYGDSWFSLMRKDDFMVNYSSIIEALLRNTNTRVKIACLKEDYDVILGYAILGSNDTLNWVYVKKDWRKLGIANSLISRPVKTVTHLSELGKQLLSKYQNCVFNPFKLGE